MLNYSSKKVVKKKVLETTNTVGALYFVSFLPEIWIYFNRFASIVPSTVGLCTFTKPIRLNVYNNIFI